MTRRRVFVGNVSWVLAHKPARFEPRQIHQMCCSRSLEPKPRSAPRAIRAEWTISFPPRAEPMRPRGHQPRMHSRDRLDTVTRMLVRLMGRPMHNKRGTGHDSPYKDVRRGQAR